MHKVIEVGWCPECGRQQCTQIDTHGDGMTYVTIGCVCGRSKAETVQVYPFDSYELSIKPLFEYTAPRKDEDDENTSKGSL